MDTNPSHVEPSPILLIKKRSTGKSDGDYVKLNLCGDTTYSTSDLNEFKIPLFNYVETEDFILLMKNSQMTLAATEIIETEAKVLYICTLVRGEALRQFDLVSDDAKMQKPDCMWIIYLRVSMIPPPCEFNFKTKSFNAPLYEKSTHIKGKALCCTFD